MDRDQRLMWPASGLPQNNMYRTAVFCMFVARDEFTKSTDVQDA